MQRLTRGLILIVFISATLFPSGIVAADVGPKPSMEFTFIQEIAGEPLEIVSGVLLQCSDPACQDAKPLEQLGPQHFACEALTCYALSYGFSDYSQLEITFSDGVVRNSNVFKVEQFNASYQVTIRQADLLVEQKFNPFDLSTLPWLCLVGLCVSAVVIVVLTVVFIRFLIRKK